MLDGAAVLWRRVAASREVLNPVLKWPWKVFYMSIDKIIVGAEYDILHIARSHGATYVRVFDSIFPEKVDSNYLGVLVDMSDGSTLLDLVAIKQDLEELLGCEVHVVTESMLSGFRSRVLKEAVSVEV